MSLSFPAGRYRINAPDVVTEDFDGQVVILNLSNGHYFSLEGIAGPIWAQIIGGQTLEAILSSIRAGRPELAGDTVTFPERLRELDLIRPDDDASPETAAIAEPWSGDAPLLTAYEDLAELIYADPVHDVDEQAGWPIPRTPK